MLRSRISFWNRFCLIDNSVPLMPQHFAFDGTDWDQDHDHEDVVHFVYEGSNDNTSQYGFDDVDIDRMY
jgi:hypothetical protein